MTSRIDEGAWKAMPGLRCADRWSWENLSSTGEVQPVIALA